MTRLFILILVTFYSIQISAQSFSDLGGAEKIWVLLHPFSAMKAKKIAKESLAITDSISQKEPWLKLNAGGRKDAFRHGLWMAMMASKVGPKRALWLGKAHEKKNIKDFKKKRLEEGYIPDQKSVEMDLFNNRVGVSIGKQSQRAQNNDLIQLVLTSLTQGEFQIIKMDSLGNSLDSLGNVISRQNWEGQWNNDRVLIPSN